MKNIIILCIRMNNVFNRKKILVKQSTKFHSFVRLIGKDSLLWTVSWLDEIRLGTWPYGQLRSCQTTRYFLRLLIVSEQTKANRCNSLTGKIYTHNNYRQQIIFYDRSNVITCTGVLAQIAVSQSLFIFILCFFRRRCCCCYVSVCMFAINCMTVAH